MPSFADSIFLFVLALLLFGPKRLPVLARELGKWVGEFRRASNEFKMQMDEELRASEQAERQKQIAAMEAAAPVPPPLEEPEHPHLRHRQLAEPTAPSAATPSAGEIHAETAAIVDAPPVTPDVTDAAAGSQSIPMTATETLDGVRPMPIASSGDLHMMPPSNGLPTPRPRDATPLGSLLDAIPNAAPDQPARPEPAFAQPVAIAQRTPENAPHGD